MGMVMAREDAEDKTRRKIKKTEERQLEEQKSNSMAYQPLYAFYLYSAICIWESGYASGGRYKPVGGIRR